MGETLKQYNKDPKKYYAKYNGQWYSITAYSQNQAYTLCKKYTGSHPFYFDKIYIPSEQWFDYRPLHTNDSEIINITQFSYEEAKNIIKRKVQNIIDEDYVVKKGMYTGYHIIGIGEVKNNLTTVTVYLARCSSEEYNENKDLHEIVTMEILNVDKLIKRKL